MCHPFYYSSPISNEELAEAADLLNEASVRITELHATIWNKDVFIEELQAKIEALKTRGGELYTFLDENAATEIALKAELEALKKAYGNSVNYNIEMMDIQEDLDATRGREGDLLVRNVNQAKTINNLLEDTEEQGTLLAEIETLTINLANTRTLLECTKDDLKYARQERDDVIEWSKGEGAFNVRMCKIIAGLREEIADLQDENEKCNKLIETTFHPRGL
jgi:chromosome segregation ATPase